MSATVTVISKPQHVAALRSTWRKSAEHRAEQIKRFLRLAAVGAVPVLLEILKGGKFDKVTLLAFLPAIVEAIVRQIWPALGAAGANSAPGVTIVPSEVAGAEAA